MEGDEVRKGAMMHNVISIHSLRMEGDLRRHRTYRRMRGFQSTPSAWRETAMQYAETLRQRISIHSLRMEGDYHRMCYIRRLWDFNPLPPHGGRPAVTVRCIGTSPISIHSLRMEGDRFRRNRLQRQYHFNPLPPHGGRQKRLCHHSPQPNFNPLPPHGGRLVFFWVMVAEIPISIHSLRMEGDPTASTMDANPKPFQSTPSAWRETTVPAGAAAVQVFQSTPSAWRETYSYSIYKVHQLFQSTPSAWRETSVSTPAALPSVISIHSLRMEGDVRILK